MGSTGVNTGGLSPVGNALPAWQSGQFGAAQLNTEGGTPPCTWALKKGSEMPYGFTLTSDGLISGTAPLLSSGTTQSISPPFTAVVTDAAGQQKEVQLSITIVQSDTAGGDTGEAPGSASGDTQNLTSPAMSIDKIESRLTRTENTEYYFDIEATGTATAPVGYELSIKLEGHSPDVQTSPWNQGGAVEFAKLIFRREPGQPETINWQAVWHNYMINQGQFDSQLNSATVQTQLFYQKDDYIDFQEKSLIIPHP